MPKVDELLPDPTPWCYPGSAEQREITLLSRHYPTFRRRVEGWARKWAAAATETAREREASWRLWSRLLWLPVALQVFVLVITARALVAFDPANPQSGLLYGVVALYGLFHIVPLDMVATTRRRRAFWRRAYERLERHEELVAAGLAAAAATATSDRPN